MVKKLLKFAAFFVIFQGLFVFVTQNFFSKRSPSPEPRVNAVLKIFTIIDQNYPMDLYSVQISLLCFMQLGWRQSNEVFELLVNLCLFGGLDVDYAEQEA